MSEQFEKYLKKLPLEKRAKIIQLIEAIQSLELKGLDVKKLRGSENLYRVKIGKLRIIFRKESSSRARIVRFNTRGDIY